MADFKVELTQEAKSDLDAIRAYTASKHSVDAADDLLDRISEALLGLETFPLRGAIPKELDAFGEHRYRQLNLGPYRLIYRVLNKVVTIALIVDGRRDLPELLTRRLLGR